MHAGTDRRATVPGNAPRSSPGTPGRGSVERVPDDPQGGVDEVQVPGVRCGGVEDRLDRQPARAAGVRAAHDGVRPTPDRSGVGLDRSSHLVRSSVVRRWVTGAAANGPRDGTGRRAAYWPRPR